MTTFNTIGEAIQDLTRGLPVILLDDEDRENEGDIVIPADCASPAIINFMIKEARGLVCLALTQEDADRLNLKQMAVHNREKFSTAFTVSIEAKGGVTTGISAYDRAITILTAINETSTPDDIVTPGHVFPLTAKKGGVLERNGHTEASIDLAKLAGFRPAGVVCEIIKDDGTMARRDYLFQFAKKHNLKIITIEGLVWYLKGK